MRCRGCGEERILIKAHIIPKSFYMDLRAGASHLKVIPSALSEFVKRSNIGDYDSEILCEACDQYLGRFDEYGKAVLIDKTHEFVSIAKYGAVAGWIISGCDSSRLNKFLLSVLWRASISSRPFFKRVKLGSYEEIIRSYLWGEQTWINNIGCVISKFNVSKVAQNAEKTIFDPDKFKYRGINYYRLYLGGFVVWVRVDQRKPKDSIGRCEIAGDGKCIVVRRSFDDSKELKIVHKGILNHATKT